MGWQPDPDGGADEERVPGAEAPGTPPGPEIRTPPGPANLDVPGGLGSEDDARDPRLAGFATGGEWDTSPPSAQLATVLAEVSGPEWRCPGASTDELIGLLRRWTAVESWVNAARLGVLRALLRDDDLPLPGRPRHGDLPDEWSESLAHQIAPALGISAYSADRMLAAAWALEARLPGTAALLAGGVLTFPKARLIIETFEFLSEEDAAKAEEMILPELPGKTFTQIQRLAAQAAVTVDPASADRRRRAAEKHRARVRVFREEAGTAGLSGRDLPTDETLAAYASLCARAAEYKESGAFGDWGMDRYRAAAFLDLINGITAPDRIAWAQATGADGPGPGTPGEPLPWPPDDDPDGDGPLDGGPEPGGPDGGGPDDGNPDGGGPDDGNPGNGGAPERGSGADFGPGRATNPGSAGGAAGESAGDGARDQRLPWLASRPVLTDLAIPLVTLLGLADRPGEGHSLGTLDPQLCRHLAAVALRSPRTTLCLTVTDADGIAIGHGCVGGRTHGGILRQHDRLRIPRPPGAGPPPLTGLPARVNLTVPAAILADMCPGAAATGGTPADTAPADTAPADTAPADTVRSWALTPVSPGNPGNPGWLGTWILTLPGGLRCPVRLIAMPTYDCDHAHESRAYQPNGTLRHLVQVRDYTCTFMTCTRPAKESDFEHAVPYDKGGRTCACNAGARSRKCHRQKQSPGWKVTQPRPGWHQWQTPSGRVYTQGPKRYPA